MSLLLDALKKAAEQKAEKARAEEGPEVGAVDETGSNLAQVGAAGPQADEAGEPLPSGSPPKAESGIDLSDHSGRHASVRERPAASDDTGIDVHEQANSALAALSQQMETGEDESIVFADEDISEFMGDPRFINRIVEEDTDLGQTVDAGEAEPAADSPFPPAEVEETDLDHAITDADQKGDADDLLALYQTADGTDSNQAEPVESADEFRSQDLAHGDDTGLNLVDVLAQADDSELELLTEADETNRAALVEDAEDSRAHAAKPGEDTDLSHVEVPADAALGVAELALEPIESGSDETRLEDDPSVILPDEDLSLLLRDDDTTTGDRATSITEGSTDHPSLLRSDASYTLNRVEPGEEQPISPADKTATVPATATTGVALNTLTTEGITTRSEPTATHTYAPDNYDRTLMKLPGEDASKLFAGMKSDSDVVMTPEYAKKVFQSKSSSHRVQHLRLYSGLIAIILLVIGVYSIFEIDQEASNIDSSLQALKRDPMPGVIKLEEEKEESLFENAGIDEQTIRLVQSAAGVSDSGLVSGGDTANSALPEIDVIAESGDSSKPDELIETEAVEAFDTIADESVTAAPPLEEALPAEAEIEEAQVAEPTVTSYAQNQSNVPRETKARDAGDTGSNKSLQLTTSSKLGEEYQLLQAAYAAYQSGNDQLALRKYSTVLEKYPSNRNALLARAAINVQNNKVAPAIEDYRQLLLANPKDSLAMTSLITVANVSPVDAETRLKLMIRDEPDSPYLNFALANAYGAQDRWREAQGHYFTALENNPHDPNYAYNLAVSLEHIAKPQVAVSYYRRALENMGNGLAMFSKEIVDQRLRILGKL